MYQRIFVAVDLSYPDRAEVILQTALQLGGENAHYLVATVLPFASNSMVSNYLPKDYRKKIKAEIHEQLSALVSKFPYTERISIGVYNGSIYEEIITEADADQSEIIVIGAGRVGKHGLGGNAARIARNFERSVFIVR